MINLQLHVRESVLEACMMMPYKFSPEALAKTYRQLAAQAHHKSAETTDDAVRWAHRFMAESWGHLAADLEGSSRSLARYG